MSCPIYVQSSSINARDDVPPFIQHCGLAFGGSIKAHIMTTTNISFFVLFCLGALGLLIGLVKLMLTARSTSKGSHPNAWRWVYWSFGLMLLCIAIYFAINFTSLSLLPSGPRPV